MPGSVAGGWKGELEFSLRGHEWPKRSPAQAFIQNTSGTWFDTELESFSEAQEPQSFFSRLRLKGSQVAASFACS